MSYLLRLVVPDRPGTLGAVATALGIAGIDIVSVDVLERADGIAVDDVVVDLPPGRVPDSLITAVRTVPGVEVESLRPYAGPLDTHRELELLDALARAAEETTAELMAAELPRVFHCGWAVVLQAVECGTAGQPWEVAAASDAAPTFEGLPLPWMPLNGPLLLPSDDGWLPPTAAPGARWCSVAPVARRSGTPS